MDRPTANRLSELGRCPECGGDDLFRVSPYRERDVYAAVLPLFRRGRTEIGHFDLDLCRGCGRVEWQARGLEELLADRAVVGAEDLSRTSVLGPCPRCGGEELWRVPVRDAGRAGQLDTIPMGLIVDPHPGGRQGCAYCAGEEVAAHAGVQGQLVPVVCRACSDVRWLAERLHELERSHPTCLPVAEACPRCRSTERWRIHLRERMYGGGITHRAVAIRIGTFGWEPWGQLLVIVCAGCGEVTWRAEQLDKLREDADARVMRLAAHAGRTHFGPYR